MAKNPRADKNWLAPWQSRERLGDFAWTLSRIDWDIFTTLTFINPVPKNDVCYSMAWRWCRALSEISGVPYNRLLLALRGEHGEAKGRFHFHCLVGGTHTRNINTLCHQSAFLWKGIASMGRVDVRPYDRSQAGADYICKTLGANAYEVGKYNWAEQVTLSDAVIRLMRVQTSRVERDAAVLHK